MAPTQVDVDSYARAGVAFQVDRVVAMGGAINTWVHFRQPTPLDQQNVIRMNRDTVYSLAVADISDGATLTIPDGAGRYLTVMAINENGYINRVFHQPGKHPLGVDEFDTSFVVLGAAHAREPVRSWRRGDGKPPPRRASPQGAAATAVAHRAVRRGELRGNQGAPLGARSRTPRLEENLRSEGQGGPRALPHRIGRGLRRAYPRTRRTTFPGPRHDPPVGTESSLRTLQSTDSGGSLSTTKTDISRRTRTTPTASTASLRSRMPTVPSR